MEHAQIVVEVPSSEWLSVALNPNMLIDLFEFKTTGVKVMSPFLNGASGVILTLLPVGELSTILVNINFNHSNLDNNPPYLDGG